MANELVAEGLQISDQDVCRSHRYRQSGTFDEEAQLWAVEKFSTPLGGGVISSAYPITFSLINDERAFTYRRNKAATDLIFTVETSTDLVNWIDAASLDLVEISTVDNGDGSESITLRLPGGDATQALRAFRLKVTH